MEIRVSLPLHPIPHLDNQLQPASCFVPIERWSLLTSPA